MWRSFALALVLMSAPLVAPARSQMPAAQPAAPAAPGANPAAPGADADRGAGPVVWGVAILCTVVILFIVCMPNRKG
jgi:hypothetical protein